jgi:flagellar hook-associated protein 3
MRITNKMLTNELRKNLNTNMMRLDQFQRQLSTGKKLNRPSDNPASLVKALRLRTTLNEGEQYLANINESVSFLETTDASLYNVGEIMQKARELVVKAATGTNDPDAHKAVAKEIRELNDQLKIIANTTYGSKHVFAGTNVTEAPYFNGRWRGNQDFLDVEVGVGVTTPINVPQMKEFFMGRMEFNEPLDKNSGISKIEAYNLKEGEYQLKTGVGTYTASSVSESQSYLHAVAKNKDFFYQNDSDQTKAALGFGTAANNANGAYSGSLAIEVKRVNIGPHFYLQPGSDKNGLTFAVDQPLYCKDSDGKLVPLKDGENVNDYFTYSKTDPDPNKKTYFTYNSSASDGISITINTSEIPAGDGDTIEFSTDPNKKLYDVEGNEFNPANINTATFKLTGPGPDDGIWEYQGKGISTVTADIKGHIYTQDGKHKEIKVNDVELDMEADYGAAIFTISAADINHPDFTDDLVIWNNSPPITDPGPPPTIKYPPLGGIDGRNPQIMKGDKTILSFSAAANNAQKVDLDYQYYNIDGNEVGNGAHSFTFNDEILDNKPYDLNFYTLDEETGVIQNGSVTLYTNTLASADPAAKFTYTAGLFGFMDDLIGKIEAGRLPQVGDQLEGKDIRMQELLYHRSTIGARINRLELQESRLTYSQESLTDLLSKNEDADLAEVTMELKMQENVYRAALAAGARIIMPTLVDFLR